MKINELRDKMKASRGEIQALDATCKTEARTYSPEETDKVNALVDQIGELSAQVKKIEEDEKHAQAARDRARAITASIVDPVAGDFAPAAKIDVGEPGWKADPKKGFKDHRAFLMEVLDVSANGKKPSANLAFLATAGSDEQGGYSKPYGGFVIPEAWSPNVLSIASETDPLAPYTTKVPMASPIVNIPARTDKTHSTSVSGGFRVYRRAEADSVAVSRMQLEEVKLEATSLMGVCHSTRELIERSAISFVALIDQGFRAEFASALMKERIRGTGVGQFQGALTLGTGVRISVAKETSGTGQAAATFVYENAIKMMARCWGFQDAVWLINQDVLAQLPLMNLAIGTGGAPVFMSNAQGPVPMTLFNRPIVISEYCSAIGTEGDVILGNWTQFLEGTYQPLRSEESMFVRWENHEQSFKFWIENDGRWWWRSVLTPYAGSTLSPVVTLAVRA